MRDIIDIADVKQRFLGHLRLERGMSANTAAAYSDDVDKLTRYLAEDTMTRRALTVMDEEFGSVEQLCRHPILLFIHSFAAHADNTDREPGASQ